MKKAIITGANGQLGNSFVEGLVKKGYFVYAIDINTENIKVLDGVDSVKLDITDEVKVHDFFSSIQDLDVLINNAGIGVFTPFEDRTAAEFKKVMEVNLLGAFLMSQSSVRIMKNSSGGKIINIASINAQKGQYGQANYSASKAGILGFTKSLAAEGAKFGVTVNSVSPGYISTSMVTNLNQDIQDSIIKDIPIGRFGYPHEIAHAIEFIINEDAGFMTGSNLAVNGGQHMF